MKLRAWFWRMMEGRYGSDRLNRAISWWGLGLMLTALVLSLFRWGSVWWVVLYAAVYLAALGLYGVTLFRFFSRNIPRRLAENSRYEQRRRLRKRRWADRRTHVYRRCPGCKSVLRLPKRRGRHSVSCPRCRRRFSVLILGQAKVPRDQP
ncbi:MAG: hypothetical protein J6125_00455 [Clostridia bacterium]|nr:hypothetical protein [Clostridia bacterium]